MPSASPARQPRRPTREPVPPQPLPPLDPLAASPLPPFARAYHCLEHIASLAAADWTRVMRRALADDALARRPAMHRVSEVLADHPQARAFGALAATVRTTVLAASRRRLILAEFTERAVGLATHAVLAVALRERLTERELAALYAPFARPAPEGEGGARAPEPG